MCAMGEGCSTHSNFEGLGFRVSAAAVMDRVLSLWSGLMPLFRGAGEVGSGKPLA